MWVHVFKINNIYAMSLVVVTGLKSEYISIDKTHHNSYTSKLGEGFYNYLSSLGRYRIYYNFPIKRPILILQAPFDS